MSVSDVDELVAVIEDLAVEVRLDECEDVLEQRVERRLVGPNRRDAEGGPLEQVVIPDLGCRDFEVVADPGLEALDDHPFFLEPPAARKVQVEKGVSENHFVRRRSWKDDGRSGAGARGYPITPATFSTWKASMMSPTFTS